MVYTYSKSEEKNDILKESARKELFESIEPISQFFKEMNYLDSLDEEYYENAELTNEDLNDINEIIMHSLIENVFDDDDESPEIVEEGANAELRTITKSARPIYKKKLKSIKKHLRKHEYAEAEKERAELEKVIKEINDKVKKLEFTPGEVAINIILNIVQEIIDVMVPFWIGSGIITFAGVGVSGFHIVKGLSSAGAEGLEKAASGLSSSLKGITVAAEANTIIKTARAIILLVRDVITIVIAYNSAKTPEEKTKAFATAYNKLRIILTKWEQNIRDLKKVIEEKKKKYNQKQKENNT